jgi:hypothetical protein
MLSQKCDLQEHIEVAMVNVAKKIGTGGLGLALPVG